MNQAKPLPPPKQKRPYIADTNHACIYSEQCKLCHGQQRFAKVAA